MSGAPNGPLIRTSAFSTAFRISCFSSGVTCVKECSSYVGRYTASSSLARLRAAQVPLNEHRDPDLRRDDEAIEARHSAGADERVVGRAHGSFFDAPKKNGEDRFLDPRRIFSDPYGSPARSLRRRADQRRHERLVVLRDVLDDDRDVLRHRRRVEREADADRGLGERLGGERRRVRELRAVTDLHVDEAEERSDRVRRDDETLAAEDDLRARHDVDRSRAGTDARLEKAERVLADVPEGTLHDGGGSAVCDAATGVAGEDDGARSAAPPVIRVVRVRQVHVRTARAARVRATGVTARSGGTVVAHDLHRARAVLTGAARSVLLHVGRMNHDDLSPSWSSWLLRYWAAVPMRVAMNVWLSCEMFSTTTAMSCATVAVSSARRTPTAVSANVWAGSAVEFASCERLPTFTSMRLKNGATVFDGMTRRSPRKTICGRDTTSIAPVQVPMPDWKKPSGYSRMSRRGRSTTAGAPPYSTPPPGEPATPPGPLPHPKCG